MVLASLRKRLLAASGLGLLFAVQVFAADGIPLPAKAERPKGLSALDSAPDIRTGQQRELFGRYLNEAYKQNFLRELARKAQQYPDYAAGAKAPKDVPSWKSVGPTGSKYIYNDVTLKEVDSGRVRTILIDPDKVDKAYVLTSGGGLWGTKNFTDDKPKWEPLTDALVSTSGGGAALGRNSDTIYVGIGDPFDVLSTVAGVAVKSTDGGKTWGAFVNLPGATSVRDVKVDTSGPIDTVLVATDVGLFRSTDGGASFALSSVGQADGKSSAWSIERSSAGWLVAMVEPDFDNFFGGFGAVYVSGNRGASWAPVPNAGNAYSGLGRATLAVGKPGDAVVYAIASDPSGFAQGDLLRSVDGGLNWTRLNVTGKAPSNPNCFQTDMNILGDQAYYNQLILVSPADATRRTVYIGGNLSTAKTSDGGANWTLVSSWLPTSCGDGVTPKLPYVHADSHAAVAFVDKGRENIVFGTDGGIFVSDDAGKTFDSAKNNNIVSLLTQTIMSTHKREDSAITGLQDTGTRARIGGSQTWNQVLGGDGEGVGWSQANNAVTLASVYGLFIARRPGLPANTGNPNDWLDGTTGIDYNNPDCFPFFTPIATPTAAADPTGLAFYTASGSRLYKTTNGAASWGQVVQFGSVAAPSCLIRRRWNNIGLHPTNLQRIALAGVGGRVLVSTNGGAAWSVHQLIGAVPGWTGFNSTARWAANNTLYAASESPVPGATRLARSTDNGATWTRADGGLPDVAVADLAVDPRDKTGATVYAATWIGVYVTRDAGKNWKLYGAGLPNVWVVGLYLSPDEDFLRVATYGRGVWDIDLKKGD